MAGWGGHLAQRARTLVAATLPAPCSKCGQPVTVDQAWDVDHLAARHARPDLAADPRNWAPAHRRCNRRAGQRVTSAKRSAAAAARRARRVQTLNGW